MTNETVFQAPASLSKQAHYTKAQYDKAYAESILHPDAFWAEQAKRLDWMTFPKTISNASYDKDVSIKWYEDGVLNVCYNCVDRHLATRADKTAIIFEADEPGHAKHISYQELYHAVCRFANGLKKMGVKKGDRVIIYMPMIPEAAYAMLACARIGAIHSVVFGGFSPQAIAGRVDDCAADFIITADMGVRGGKKIPLKANIDQALSLAQYKVKQVLVVQYQKDPIAWHAERDCWYHEVIKDVAEECPVEPMSACDPLFILYTSGSTGKPKGVLHHSGGYLVYASLTHHAIFDYHEDDIYWCTADVGWITGHSYIIYGPLSNGATTLMFEGVPTYPTPARFWQVIDAHKVSIFYTAPTAIRALLSQGDEYVKQTSRKSLRLLGSVGEPINKDAWLWYYEVVGERGCAIVDTWWQTETGGILITPLPGATAMKPGSATLPFFGIEPVLLDAEGKEIEGEGEGALCIKHSWPGQMHTVYNAHQRFIETYFSRFPGYYQTGDGARRDKDGYYWITGRMDDVLNVSGHRLGTAEIESALDSHKRVAEAAVVGFPHQIKGEGIYAYVILNKDEAAHLVAMDDDSISKELSLWVRQAIGPIATPDFIQIVPDLPKTRSGKIMRRILRKIAANDYAELGDTNTLTNPDVVEKLIAQRKNQ